MVFAPHTLGAVPVINIVKVNFTTINETIISNKLIRSQVLQIMYRYTHIY